ncbi:MAG: hypothetical protein PF448_04640 [Bacteroidales bacterium]|jgi:hypothetical protein|nr:hypothetical protein [Bacteroidales bacterium]
MKNKNKSILSHVILSFFLLVSVSSYAQFKMQRSYEVSLTNLPWQDLTFIYTQRLDSLRFLEVTNSFVLKKQTEYDVNTFLFRNIDPFAMYNLYRLRIGVRKFRKPNKYFTPLLALSYGGYNNGTLENFIDQSGDAYDQDWVLDRRRIEVGIIAKFGSIKTYEDRYIRDIYWGVGLKLKIIRDMVLEKTEWGYIIPDDYPIETIYPKIMPTIHFGVLVGRVE